MPTIDHDAILTQIYEKGNHDLCLTLSRADKVFDLPSDSWFNHHGLVATVLPDAYPYDVYITKIPSWPPIAAGVAVLLEFLADTISHSPEPTDTPHGVKDWMILSQTYADYRTQLKDLFQRRLDNFFVPHYSEGCIYQVALLLRGPDFYNPLTRSLPVDKYREQYPSLHIP